MQKWETPVLEVLEISKTMAGPGKQFVDQSFEDEDEKGDLHHS